MGGYVPKRDNEFSEEQANTALADTILGRSAVSGAALTEAYHFTTNKGTYIKVSPGGMNANDIVESAKLLQEVVNSGKFELRVGMTFTRAVENKLHDIISAQNRETALTAATDLIHIVEDIQKYPRAEASRESIKVTEKIIEDGLAANKGGKVAGQPSFEQQQGIEGSRPVFDSSEKTLTPDEVALSNARRRDFDVNAGQGLTGGPMMPPPTPEPRPEPSFPISPRHANELEHSGEPVGQTQDGAIIYRKGGKVAGQPSFEQQQGIEGSRPVFDSSEKPLTPDEVALSNARRRDFDVNAGQGLTGGPMMPPPTPEPRAEPSFPISPRHANELEHSGEPVGQTQDGKQIFRKEISFEATTGQPSTLTPAVFERDAVDYGLKPAPAFVGEFDTTPSTAAKPTRAENVSTLFTTDFVDSLPARDTQPQTPNTSRQTLNGDVIQTPDGPRRLMSGQGKLIEGAMKASTAEAGSVEANAGEAFLTKLKAEGKSSGVEKLDGRLSETEQGRIANLMQSPENAAVYKEILEAMKKSGLSGGTKHDGTHLASQSVTNAAGRGNDAGGVSV